MAKIIKKHKAAPAQDDMPSRYFHAHPDEDPQGIERYGRGGIKRKLTKAGDGTIVPGIPGMGTQPAAPITPQDREGWNKYQSALVSAPGRYVRNWDHSEDFQKETAAKTGWDYSKNAAIQADMKSGSHAVSGVTGGDPWGGNPNWAGSRESQKGYTKYTYQQKDKNGNVYYSEDHGTEAIPKSDIAGFTDRAHQSKAPTWQTNDQNIPMNATPDQLMKLPNNADAYNPTPITPTQPAFDKDQAVAGRVAREADTTGKYDSMYTGGPSAAEAGGGDLRGMTATEDTEQYGGGGMIKRLYKTPLPQNQYFPSGARYSNGGWIRRAETGDIIPGGTNLAPPPTGTPPGGDGRWAPPPGTPPPPVAPPTGAAPPPPPADPPDPSEADPKGDANKPAQAAPQVSHNQIGFSTKGLVMAGLQGADALVTEAIYNPKMRAREAQMQKDMSQSVTGPNDFYGHGMGMYGMGGRVYGSGGTSTDYETDPGNANALVESGEQLQTPDGSTMPVTGNEQHSDKPNGMGGKYMDLDPGTRVYSKKKLIDKGVASAITDAKFTRKASPADLVRKYKTDNEEEVLNSKLSDPIAITTANMMKGIKDGKKDQVFQAQEIAAGRGYGPQMGYGGQVRRYDTGGDDLKHFQQAPDVDDPDAPHDIDRLPTNGPNPMAIPSMQPIQMAPIPADKMPELPDPYDPDAPSGLQKAWRGTRDFIANHTHGNLRDAGLYAPEAMATLHALTDHPIWSPTYQPVYNKAHQLNIQADLNRQQSLAYPGMQRSFGNAGVDAGRRSATLATLVDSSNQLGQDKANYDSKQRVDTDNQNASIENDANWKRIQMANMLSDKMAQRQFNKDRTLENATESATNKGYALQKGREYEKNSLGVLNKMYPNWKYDSKTGLTPHNEGPWVHMPYGGLGSQQPFDPNDNGEDTRTINGKRQTRKWVDV